MFYNIIVQQIYYIQKQLNLKKNKKFWCILEQLEQHYYYVPLPLRGPVNSTCVEAGGGGLREAPALRPPLRFLVYVQRFAFLPNYLMIKKLKRKMVLFI